MNIIETERLNLRKFVLEDAGFVLNLANDPDWIKYIGDRGIRNIDDAVDYINNGPLSSYEEFGFGLYVVELKTNLLPIGICGLLKRPHLEHADLGFAFLPDYRGFGYAFEAGRATLDYGFSDLGLNPILAITAKINEPSINLLTKLGMKFDKTFRAPNDKTETRLFSIYQ